MKKLIVLSLVFAGFIAACGDEAGMNVEPPVGTVASGIPETPGVVTTTGAASPYSYSSDGNPALCATAPSDASGAVVCPTKAVPTVGTPVTAYFTFLRVDDLVCFYTRYGSDTYPHTESGEYCTKGVSATPRAIWLTYTPDLTGPHTVEFYIRRRADSRYSPQPVGRVTFTVVGSSVADGGVTDGGTTNPPPSTTGMPRRPPVPPTQIDHYGLYSFPGASSVCAVAFVPRYTSGGALDGYDCPTPGDRSISPTRGLWAGVRLDQVAMSQQVTIQVYNEVFYNGVSYPVNTTGPAATFSQRSDGTQKVYFTFWIPPANLSLLKVGELVVARIWVKVTPAAGQVFTNWIGDFELPVVSN